MTRDCWTAMPGCSRRRPLLRSSDGRYRRRLAAEQQAAAVYRALAAKRTGEDREILLALARAEERHAAHWAAKLHPTQRPSGPLDGARGCSAGWPDGWGRWSCSAWSSGPRPLATTTPTTRRPRPWPPTSG